MKVYSDVRGQMVGWVVLLAAGAAHAWETLARFEHLVDREYVLRFGAFSFALSLLAYALFALFLCRWNRPLLVSALVGLGVFVPARLLNERSPRVLVVDVEGLRADRMSLYGARNGTTPLLESWIEAQPGTIVFEDVDAHSTDRAGAVTALLSGAPLDVEAPWIDEVLGDDGRLTRVAFTSHAPRAPFARRFDDLAVLDDEVLEVPAMLQNFRRWFAAAPAGSVNLLDYSAFVPVGRPAPEFDVFAQEGAPPPRAFSRLDERDPATLEPLDLVHALDHYDGGVFELDAHLGGLLLEMSRAGELDDVAVVLTSSTGWAYFEHGEFGRGGLPFDEVVRVPLVMRLPSPLRFPALHPKVERVAAHVAHADVLPTLSGFLGVETELPGRDLCAALYAGSAPVDAGTPLEGRSRWGAVVGVRLRGWKLLLVPDASGELHEQLWQVNRPGREARVEPDHAPSIGELRGLLEAWHGVGRHSLVADGG